MRCVPAGALLAAVGLVAKKILHAGPRSGKRQERKSGFENEAKMTSMRQDGNRKGLSLGFGPAKAFEARCVAHA